LIGREFVLDDAARVVTAAKAATTMTAIPTTPTFDHSFI
jgi:hypothetical protein